MGTDTDRRTFLTVAAAGGASILLSAAPGAAFAAPSSPPRTRVYVLVVDGCRPDEITTALTPRLAALRARGTNYPAARSLPIMETIPNHVMMMTGVRPNRSGVPANSIFDGSVVRDMDRMTDIKVGTLLERLKTRNLRTGSVLSKEYLFGVFGTRATYRWEPNPLVPITNHAPDQFTIDALIAMVDTSDPDFVFVNLGDVDRIGHSDITGTTVMAARSAALFDTDRQIGRFVDRLVATRKWATSILMVLADHSMDFSVPSNVVSVTSQLRLKGRADLAAGITIAQNGGADLVYWTGAASARTAGLADIRSIMQATPGVLRIQAPAELRLSPNAGDLVLYCKAGWRFADPFIVSNPIPGNHGHPATEPIPFFVTGGSPRVRRGFTSSDPARTVDVAPTVAAIFGLAAPTGGWDGTARRSALV